MKFKDDVLLEYCSQAPLALALERVVECRIYPRLSFERPIMDLGCGEGLFASILFEEKVDTGIDPNSRELERARELGAYEELIECYGDNVPKADASYRTIFSNSVVEHIEDLEPVLKEMNRLLVEGGYFHFTAPSPNFERFTVINLLLEKLGLEKPSKAFRSFFNRFWVHYHTYPLGGWIQLAERAGFEVVEAYTYSPQKTCLLNTIFTPFGVPGKIIKSLTNRWSLFPRFSAVIMRPICSMLRPLIDGAERAEDGGLVFLSLRKRAA